MVKFRTVRHAQQALEWAREDKMRWHGIWKNSDFKNDAAYEKYIQAMEGEKEATKFLKDQGALD